MSLFNRHRLIVFFLPLLLALPFLNRAYFVDDSYFVEIAQWLKDHPAQPYDFRTDDAGLQNPGWEKDGFVRMVNPLVHHYYLAALLKIGGEREWFLRLGCVLLSCGSGLFLLGLARRFTDHPLAATVLALVTPAFWLTSYSLLIDGTMGFFFFGALYFFIRLHETERWPFAVASGVFMGLSILSKYPAVFIVPLTALFWFLRRRSLRGAWWPFIPWAIGALFLTAYSVATARLYGAPHILAASRRMLDVYGWAKIVNFLIFFSGATTVPLVVWGFVSTWTRTVLAMLAVALMSFFATDWGGFSLVQSALIALWAVTTVGFAVVAAHRLRHSDRAGDLFLLGWAGGFIVMMLLVMGWVAARYYVIVVPAIAWIAVRLFETVWVSRARAAILTTIGVTFVTGLSLAYADYRQASPMRRIGPLLEERGIKAGPRSFYLGDSFTMAYLKRFGWTPAFSGTEFQRGDLILGKSVTMPQLWFRRKPVVLELIAGFNFPSKFPIKVMDYHGSAGFYASVWGTLPYTISSGPWESFQVFRVVDVRESNKAK